jgi:hypothetical protein
MVDERRKGREGEKRERRGREEGEKREENSDSIYYGGKAKFCEGRESEGN